ncbi:MAG: DUF1643 domain-containing protein [Dethiobacteraceae bacterium]
MWRCWNTNRPKATFVLLNPSTADETENDPTVSRCVRYAVNWGYGSLYVVNIFALRSTDPRQLYLAEDPIGPENDKYIYKVASESDLIVLAFGNHGAYLNRGQTVISLLSGLTLHHLIKTKEGFPGHPLYLKKDLKPILWRP